MRDAATGWIVTAIALSFFGVFVAIGWLQGWFDNQSRSDVLYQQNAAAQAALEDDLDAQIIQLGKIDTVIKTTAASDPYLPELVDERALVLNQSCETAAHVMHPTGVHLAWRKANCEAH